MISTTKFNDLKILVVGDIMLDRYWMGEVTRISPEAPVPVISVNDQTERIGGAGNVATNLKALGVSTGLISVVGNDQSGRALSKLLDEAGIVSMLQADQSMDTIVKLRILSKNQQLLRADFETPPTREILDTCLEIFEKELAGYDAVIISDYGKGGLKHIKNMIQLAQRQNIPTIVDPKGSDFSRYQGATLITPNQLEFESVVGVTDNAADFDQRAHQLLKSLSIKALLVTRSEKGMSYYSEEGETTHSPARAREVYDVSGAGDTVIAVITAAYCANMSTEQQLLVANTAAGIVVGKLGTAVVDQGQLLKELAQQEST